MWLSAIIVMIVHLIISGVLCLIVDEIDSRYTLTTFVTYLIALSTKTIKDYCTLVAGIIYDRENTLKSFDKE